VKLRAYQPSTKKKKLYPTNLVLTIIEFQRSYGNEKPRGDKNKQFKRQIEAIMASTMQYKISIAGIFRM